MNIVAFSDYHVHSLNALMSFLNDLPFKPDLIFYAGDAISRFGQLNDSILDAILEKEEKIIRSELKEENFVIYRPMVGYHIVKIQIGNEKIHRSCTLDEVVVFGIKREVAFDDIANFVAKQILKTYHRDHKSIYQYGASSLLHKVAIEYDKKAKEITLNDIVDFLQTRCKIGYKKKRKRILGYIHLTGEVFLNNIFQKLSELSKLGICVVAGNDDHPIHKTLIQGEKVFDVHNEPFIFGNFAVIGVEGSPIEAGPCGCTCYKEEDMEKHLENMYSKVSDKNVILLTHTPPFGILDRSIRFGERNIGSKSIRKIIEEKDNIILNVCGHSHINGRKELDFKGCKVVNVASHDDDFSPANIAIIKINENEIKITWRKIPSNIELILKNKKLKEEEKRKQLRKIGFSEKEIDSILNVISLYGNEFIENIEKLYRIKIEYGFSWRALIEFFKQGMRSEEDITKKMVERAIKSLNLQGVFRNMLMKAYLRLKSKKKQGIVIHEDLTPLTHSKKIYFDIEYLSPAEKWIKEGFKPIIKNTIPIVYGFMKNNEIKQFIIGEEEKVAKFVKEHIEKGYKFYFYGGNDRKIILKTVKEQYPKINISKIKENFVNVLYLLENNVGFPTRSYSLPTVFYHLYPELKEKTYTYEFSNGSKIQGKSKLPYETDALIKIVCLSKILRKISEDIENLKNTEELDFLKKTNITDIVMLNLIVERLLKSYNRHTKSHTI